MQGNKGLIDKLIILVFLSCIFLLSLVEIYSYDIWFHLSYGREVLRLGYIPQKEIFLFSIPDYPMINHEWLFGIIAYIIWTISGPAGIVLMKAVLITSIFFILFMDCFNYEKNPIIIAVILFVTSIIMRMRFIERPELFAYLFLTVNLYLIHMFIDRGLRWWLLCVPVVQLLWVNIHGGSSVLMPFICILYLALGVIIDLFNRKSGYTIPGAIDRDGLKIFLIVSVLVFAVSLLNPFTYHIFKIPWELQTKTIYKHAITELQPLPLNIRSIFFWYMVFWLIITILSVKKIYIADFILSVLFLYMSLQAKRFLPLFLITSSTLIVKNLSYLKSALRDLFAVPDLFRGKRIAYITLTLYMILLPFMSFVIIKGDDEVRFGLGVYPYRYPENAIRYLKDNGIKANLFNTFHFGGYIEWRYYPDGKPIIDGRGPMYEKLLEKILLAEDNRLIWRSLEGMYGFEAGIVENPVIKKTAPGTDIPYLQLVEKGSFAPEDWALVYWDDSSLLYLKRNEKFKRIIERDEYRYATPLMWHMAGKHGGKETYSEYIKELERNIRQNPECISSRVYLSMILLEIGDVAKAKAILKQIEEKVSERYTRLKFGGLYYSLLARCYLTEGNMADATGYYEKAVALTMDPAIWVSLAELYLKTGNESKGEKILTSLIKGGSRNIQAINLLKKYYSDTNQSEKLRTIEQKYNEGIKILTGEEHFIRATKLYMSKHFDEAIREYIESLRVNPSSPPAWTNLGYVYFDTGRLEEAKGCFIKALELEPDWPEAHYGLGLIYERMNERERAIAHFQRYLKINPRGFWSKRAEERIARLKGK